MCDFPLSSLLVGITAQAPFISKNSFQGFGENFHREVSDQCWEVLLV